jgi:hypothetical protein
VDVAFADDLSSQGGASGEAQGSAELDGAKEVIEIQGGIGPDEARILEGWSKRVSR